MNKDEKGLIVSDLAQHINEAKLFYLADVTGLNAEQTSQFRRLCAQKQIKMTVVKNTLLKKAFEATGKDFSEIFSTLKGTTAILFAEKENAPARLIKEFRKPGMKLPDVKSAYISQNFYIGHGLLETLSNIKSKEEMLGEIIGMLQSPIRNVLAALQNKKEETAA